MKSQSNVIAALAVTTIALSTAACTNSPSRNDADSQAPQATTVESRAGKADNHASAQAGPNLSPSFDTVITVDPFFKTMWVKDISFNGYASGRNNTVYGVWSGASNTTGSNNSAFGAWALRDNATGSQNSGFGAAALQMNTSGTDNTAVGTLSLLNNTTGGGNTAVGSVALAMNTTGVGNTAMGESALVLNALGAHNTGIGKDVLYNNNASGNTASGEAAMYQNASGEDNTSYGRYSLNQSTGSRNIAVGAQAGCTLTSGGNNIYIGNLGRSAESNVIRIGGDGTSATCPNSVTPATQTLTYIAGISGVSVASSDTPAQVYVGSDGQLGIQASSRRFKRNIEPIGGADSLLKLRPVSFRYAGGSHDEQPRALQYGLVAEEVAEVMPELVSFDATGRPFAVNYQFLAPLLLAFMKAEHQKVKQQGDLLDMLAEQNKALRQDITDLRRLLAERSVPPVR